MIGRQTLEVIYESRFSEYYLNIVRDFQIYWGSTTTRLFSLKFTGHFQNIFFSMWIFEEDFYKAFEVYAVVFLSVWFLCGARFFSQCTIYIFYLLIACHELWAITKMHFKPICNTVLFQCSDTSANSSEE